MHTATARAALVLTGLLALGCSGLFGYGEEFGATTLQDGSGFKLDFTAGDNPEATYQLWLEYDVSHTSAYQLGGTLDFKRKTGGNESYTLDLTDSGSPIKGGSGRMSLNKRQTNLNGKGSMSETVFLTDLPKMKPGEKARIVGTVTTAKGTTLNSARLVVTD